VPTHRCGPYCTPALSVHAWTCMASPSYTKEDVIETGTFFHPDGEILDAWPCEGASLAPGAVAFARDGTPLPLAEAARAPHVPWLMLVRLPPWYRFDEGV
jgi:hypothetical protein